MILCKLAIIGILVRPYLAYLVSLIDQLVRSRNQLESVDMVEFSRNLITEQPSSTSGANSPRLDILWVGPDKIAECSLMRNLLSSGDHSDLIDSPDFGA